MSAPERITDTRHPKPLNFNMFNTSPFVVIPEWIATATPGQAVLRHHALAVDSNGTIVSVGDAVQITKQYESWHRIELPGHLLTPGLINLHTHAAMSLLRGSGDDMPLEAWLQKRIWPLESRLVSPHFVYDGTVLACAEMLKSGVTTFQDMYFYQDEAAKAAIALGMRASLSVVVIDFPTPYANTPKEHLAKGLAVKDSLRGEPLLQFVLAPHAPYSVSDDTFNQVITLAQELDMPVHCHIHETQTEIADSVKSYGLRPMARLAKLGLLETRLVAAHAVHLSEAEIALISRHGVGLAHCPHSNLKLASGVANVPAWLAAGLTWGVGTDSAASNNRLDVLGETRTAALLAKGVSQASGELNAATLNAQQALHAMTLGAATALGLDHQIGELLVGKQADMTAFDLSDSALSPVSDPLSTLIYAAGREHVASVWVNGRNVVEKRQLVGFALQGTVSEVTARIPLWHNRIGDIVSAVA